MATTPALVVVAEDTSIVAAATAAAGKLGKQSKSVSLQRNRRYISRHQHREKPLVASKSSWPMLFTAKNSIFHVPTMLRSFDFIIFVLLCLTSISMADTVVQRPLQDNNRTDYYDTIPSSSSSPLLSSPSSTSTSTRILNLFSGLTSPNGNCHMYVSTLPVLKQETVAHGILFVVKSDDAKGVMITSLGFHIQPSSVTDGKQVEYELRVLNVEGHYASTERNPEIPQYISLDASNDFDYRGDLDAWTKIAGGQISEGDLTKDSTTATVTEADYFQIPFGMFEKISIPSGGLRSFYIGMPKSHLIIASLEGDEKLNSEMSLRDNGDAYAPKILVGESTVSYPMPQEQFAYIAKTFVGQVYYEEECISLAPSVSAQPSSAPNVPSQIPSVQPSQWSEQPSAVPSGMPSYVPSSKPSEYTLKTASGILTRIAMDCIPNSGEALPGEKDFPKDEADIVAASVQKIAAEKGENTNPPTRSVEAEVISTYCITLQQRHLIVNPSHTEGDFNHRLLPSSSSAVDFSVVITGEYSPPSRPGQDVKPPADIGRLTEDSINRDRTGFVKDIKKRAAVSETISETTRSKLAKVEETDIIVQSFEVEVEEAFDPEGSTVARFTLQPTPSPTTEDKTESILTICIIATAGLIVLLSAFLLFRHGERRAAKQRREKMEQLEDKKVKAKWDKQRRAEKERAKMLMSSGNPNMSMAKGPPPQYGNPLGHGHQPPPPPPNYYGGGSQPQNYNYGYGWPPQPPPQYGQHYGSPGPQGYPYPPPGQSGNYGQPPPGQSGNYGQSPTPGQYGNYGQPPPPGKNVNYGQPPSN